MYLIIFPASLRALSVLLVRGISAVTVLRCSSSLHILSAVELEISIILYLKKIVTHCGLSAWGAIAVADRHYIFAPLFAEFPSGVLRNFKDVQARLHLTAVDYTDKSITLFFIVQIFRVFFHIFLYATRNNLNINNLTLFCCKFTHDVTLFYLCCRLSNGNPTTPEVVRGQTKSLTK